MGVLKLLLEAGARIDAVGKDGSTPLLGAIVHKQMGAVELLLKAGADKDKPDDVGATPLHAACIAGQQRAVELLLQAGADKNKRDKHRKWTPHRFATSLGHLGIAALLENDPQPRGNPDLPAKGGEGLPEELRAKMIAELIDEDQSPTKSKSKKTNKKK
jgi:ankyrin repeat protein